MEPRRYGPFPYSAIIDRPKLELPGGAQSDDATSDHSRTAGAMRQGHIRGQIARTPGQRHPCPTVTVIVDDGLMVELFRLHHESRGAIRSQAHGRVNNTVPGNVHRNEIERRADAVRRGRPRLRRFNRAGTDSHSSEGHGAGLE